MLELVHQLANTLVKRGESLALAESCTGGMLSKYCTDLTGSSTWFECAIVCYSNNSKNKLLGVKVKTLREMGAVSEAVADEMAQGVLNVASVGHSIAITGIAGPTGGSANKPVGTVCFAWKGPDYKVLESCHFNGCRESVREQAARYALMRLLEILNEDEPE